MRYQDSIYLHSMGKSGTELYLKTRAALALKQLLSGKAIQPVTEPDKPSSPPPATEKKQREHSKGEIKHRIEI
jgi:hypothetical protein